MAVTVVNNLNLWSAADATTGWVSDGDTPAAYSGFQREGSNNLGIQISQTTTHVYIPTGSGDAPGSSQNLSNQRIYCWVFVWGSLDTKANGGLRIVLGDGTNRRAYYVGGSDDYGFQVGGWTCIVLDTGNLPSSFATLAGASAPTLTAITQVGVGAKYLNKATGNVDNFYWDVVRYGLGITVYGGTAGDPGTFAEIAADDASTTSGKAYGVIREIQTGVYGVQGDITWGDNGGTNTFYFKDESAVVVVEDRVHGSGTPTDITLSVVGNSTAATQHFELGVAVGSGDTQTGRNGVDFINANIASQPIVFDASDADLDEFSLYGCKLVGINKTGSVFPKFSADATLGPNHVLSGCTFDRCGQADLGRVPTRNCVFTGHTGTDAALLWNANINIKNSQFIANTDGTNNPAGIEHDAGGSVTYDNLTFAGNDFDIYLSHATASLTVGATNGANPSTKREGGTGTVTINNTVTLLVHVQDSAEADLAGAEVTLLKATPEVYTSAAGNNQGDTDFVVQETIASTGLPTNGWIRVRHPTTYSEQTYRFASYSGSTFALPTKVGPFACSGGGTSTLLQDTTHDFTAVDIKVGDTVRNETDGSWAIVLEIIDSDNVRTTPLTGGTDDTWTSGDNWSVHSLALGYGTSEDVFVPLLLDPTDSNGDAQTTVYNYGTATNVSARARKAGKKPNKASGQITTAGVSLTIQLDDQPNYALTP